jgi:hypothetical protein
MDESLTTQAARADLRGGPIGGEDGVVSHHLEITSPGFQLVGVPALDAARLAVERQYGPEVLRQIDGYRPRWNDEDLVIFDDVLAPVIEMFCIKALAIGIDRAFDQLRYGAGFILDAYKRRGLTDLEVMFAPEHIHWWVFGAPVNTHKSDAWRKSAVAYLHTTGRIVSPRTTWPVRAPQVSRQKTLLPYGEADEQCFVEVALAKRGKRGPRMRFAVGAAFGAGLDGRDIPHVVADDIVELGAGRIGIEVKGQRARLAIVRAKYTSIIQQAVSEAGEGRLIGASARPVGLSRRTVQMWEVWKSIEVKGDGGLGRIDPARARNTWIAHHLAAGTPIHFIVQMAGGGIRPIMDLLAHVKLEDEQAAYIKALSV